MKDNVSIYDFKDYREYLKEVFEERKAKFGKYSFKRWSEELGLSSVSGLTMVIKGQRNPGPSISEKLISNLNLDQKEEEYFLKLVDFTKTSKNNSSMFMYMLDNDQEFNLDDSQRPLSFKWQMGFLREAVKWQDFKETKTWLDSKIRFTIDKEEIEEILKEMKDVGALKYSNQALSVDKDFTFERPTVNYFKNLHRDFLKMAELSYETEQSKRILEYRMIMVKKEDIPRAQKRLKELMNEFIKEFDQEEAHSKDSEIYLTSIYLLPISK